MLKPTILLLSSTLAAQAALACSCVVEDQANAAAIEYDHADIVVEGYLLSAQVTPLEGCTNSSDPADAFEPFGLFKVIEVDKGVSMNSYIIAKLGGVSPVAYDENCVLQDFGTSCHYPFSAQSFGSVDAPRWIAFTSRRGELWSNTHQCSAFPEHGQDMVDRISKRDTL